MFAGGAISRVLSSRFPVVTVIPLGPELPQGSSDLTRKLGGGASSGGVCTPPAFLFGIAPSGVCHATHIAVCPVGSYPTFSPLPRLLRHGGIFSVALSVTLPLKAAFLAVSQHCARWSPDFPLDFGLFPLQRPSTPPAAPAYHTLWRRVTAETSAACRGSRIMNKIRLTRATTPVTRGPRPVTKAMNWALRPGSDLNKV